MQSSIHPGNLPSILDIEASSLEPGGFPIQVAWSVGRQLISFFIRPEQPRPGWRWDNASETMHGIHREYLIEHGTPPAKVANEMNKSLSGDIVYSDALAFDRHWCDQLFLAADLDRKFHIACYWELLALHMPRQPEHPDKANAGAWLRKIERQAVSRLPDARKHLADHDVRIRMEMLLIAMGEASR